MDRPDQPRRPTDVEQRVGPRSEAAGTAGDTDPGTSLASLRAERDDALTTSYRQRDRLQEQLERTRATLRDKDRALKETRAKLERLQGRPLVRAENEARRIARAVRRRRPGRNRDADGRPTPAPAGANLAAEPFRRMLLDRLDGPSAAAGGPIRIGVLAAAPDQPGPPGSDTAVPRAIVDALGTVGIEASVILPPPPEVPGETGNPTIDPMLDVLLLLAPSVKVTDLPRHAVTVAWLGDAPGSWIGSPRIDDVDIVLVADDDARREVEARTAKVATVAPPPTTPDGAEALRGAVRRWVTARRVAIHIGPNTWEAAASWGDLPFGRAVQKAFERRGWPATVLVHAERDTPPAVRADLALHIFGVRAPEVRPGQVSVLWIISHPDYIRRDLCRPYDLVGVGSDSFLAYLRGWLGADAPTLLPLHQATDPERFFPEAGGPAHELLFVGNSRFLRRAILDALAGTTFDLAVYGRNWTPELVDQRYVRGEWIANEGLRRYYASAAIVLSDSYPDMRDEGFIANRVYDALASGAFVISEPVRGLAAEFDDAVVTYRDRAELLELVEHYLAHPDERTTLATRGREAVLARHTFAHRVDALIAAVEPLLLDRDRAAMTARQRA